MRRITVKQYAESRGVTPEIVRRQIIRYENELRGHVVRSGRARMLDETAVSILDLHRHPKVTPLDIAEVDPKGEIEELRKNVEELLGKLSEAQNRIMELQNQQIELQKEQITLIEEKSRYQGMIEERDRNQQSQEKRISDQEQKITELQTEISSFQRSIFGFYRKKK